ncbi:MAG: pilin [Patescibacteria group bacterium]|nr:pilin [Patescibacteria group bacterium]
MLPFFTTLLAQGPIREWYDDPSNPGNSGCMVDGVPTLKCAEIVFTNLLVMASGLVILILFIMFVIGAFNYLTSLGDEEKMTNARNTFTYAIIGLVVFVSAGLILWIIDILFLGGQGRIFEFRIGV